MDRFVLDCCNSIANVLELQQSHTKPLKLCFILTEAVLFLEEEW